jgi:Xaa-Pro aminopeptidase
MKYLPIDSALFIENRKKFVSHLNKNSIAVFNSNDVLPSNADGHMRFFQSSDLFYLTGIDQEETILVLAPNTKLEGHQEVLFLRETNPTIAVWEGHKYTKAEATATSGIKKIYWVKDFENILNLLALQEEEIYLNTNEHTRAVIETQTREARFIDWCKNKYPLHTYRRSAPIMHRIRAVKSAIEIELIQTACNITEKGFRRLLSFIKPNVWEFEIEAELIHEFTKNRSKGFAYTPIIASGQNSCVLHYIENNQQCKNDDIILLDVAAEYANYNSDLTRCVPINGKFSERQKQVYNAVLKVMRQATQLLVVGNTWDNYHAQVGKIMEQELIQLGLLNAQEVENQNPEAPLYKKYFMHGTSHFLGLDVHDVGNKYIPFEEGNVFTCEPGIYIPAENIGIRIENNILVTKNGPVDLMKNIPIEVEELEQLMAQ